MPYRPKSNPDSSVGSDSGETVTVYMDVTTNRRVLLHLRVTNCTERLRNVLSSIFLGTAKSFNRNKADELEAAIQGGGQPEDFLIFEQRRGLVRFRIAAIPTARGAYGLDIRVWDEGDFVFHAAALYVVPVGRSAQSENRLTIYRDYSGYWEIYLK